MSIQTESAAPTQEDRRRAVKAMLGCLVAANAAGTAPLAIAQSRPKVKIGYNVVPMDSQMHLAREDKLFERHGLDPSWIRFESGGAMVQAIAAGDIDFASASEIPGIRPRLLGGKYVIVAQGATAPRYTGIYARTAIRTPKDLVGKRVGITMGTISEWYLGMYAERYGVPLDKVQKLNVAPPEWLAALNRGDIDAFAGWEHFFSKADEILPKGTGHLLHSGDVDHLYSQPMYYYMSEALANTPAAARVMKALLEVEQAMQTQRQRAAELSARVASIDTPTSRKIVDMVSYRIGFDDRSLDSMRAAASYLLGKKLIDREPDWATFVNLAPLRAVAPERVTVTKVK